MTVCGNQEEEKEDDEEEDDEMVIVTMMATMLTISRLPNKTSASRLEHGHSQSMNCQTSMAVCKNSLRAQLCCHLHGPEVVFKCRQRCGLPKDSSKGLVLAAKADARQAVPFQEVDRRRRVSGLYPNHTRVHLRGRPEVVLSDLKHIRADNAL